MDVSGNRVVSSKGMNMLHISSFLLLMAWNADVMIGWQELEGRAEGRLGRVHSGTFRSTPVHLAVGDPAVSYPNLGS